MINVRTLRFIFSFQLILFFVFTSSAQVGINTETPDASAALDITSPDKGLLIPRVDTSAISSPATGLMVFRPADNGFYFYNGNKWQLLGSVVQSSIMDTDGDTKIEVDNGTDNDRIKMFIDDQERLLFTRGISGISRIDFPNNNFNIAFGYMSQAESSSGIFNTSIGYESLFSSDFGNDNIAIGYRSLYSNSGFDNIALGQFSLLSNTEGSFNVALGKEAMKGLNGQSSGDDNIAIGNNALSSYTIGYQNIAIGKLSLYSNSEGHDNTAHGNSSLYSNTFGSHNTAFGLASLYSNTIGNHNIAFGLQSMQLNIDGSHNIAMGHNSLKHGLGDDNIALGNHAMQGVAGQSSGYANIAIGDSTLFSNTTGYNNIAQGTESLFTNTTGHDNSGIGFQSLHKNTNGTNNIANGYQSLYSNTTGNENIGIGIYSLRDNTSGSNNVAIGPYAMNKMQTGSSNTAIGQAALENNSEGIDNVALGSFAVQSNTTGTGNTGVGKSALKNNTIGVDNVALGNDALGTNSSGSGNVGIGFNAGKNETGSNKLYIENSDADLTSALIYGDFASDQLRVNSSLGIGTSPGIFGLKVKQKSTGGIMLSHHSLPSEWSLYVNGTNNLLLYHNNSLKGNFDATSGAYTATSDIRLKENIEPYTSALQDIIKLGVANKYNYIDDAQETMQLGYIAQDLVKVLPEFVSENEVGEEDSLFTVNYAGLSAVAISAIYEQQKIMDALEERIKKMETMIVELREVEQRNSNSLDHD